MDGNVQVMRTEGFKEYTITCDHCGAFCGRAEILEGGAFKTAEMCAAEVYFSPPGNRGGITWQDENGEWMDSRVTLHDSCSKCAAKVMRIVDSFYDSSVADDLEQIRMVVREEIERSKPKIVLHDQPVESKMVEVDKVIERYVSDRRKWWRWY